MWAADGAAHAGAAKRRRERRLRAYLRYARMSVAMALAENNHHSAPRRPTMARARGEESEMNYAMGLTTPPPEAASTQYFALDDDGDEVPKVLCPSPVQGGAVGRGRSLQGRRVRFVDSSGR